jgi:hypothetical protein
MTQGTVVKTTSIILSDHTEQLKLLNDMILSHLARITDLERKLEKLNAKI